jgi:hypothetical protein
VIGNTSMDVEVRRIKYRGCAMVAIITILVPLIGCFLGYAAIQNRVILPPTFAARINSSTYLLSILRSEPRPGATIQTCKEWKYATRVAWLDTHLDTASRRSTVIVLAVYPRDRVLQSSQHCTIRAANLICNPLSSIHDGIPTSKRRRGRAHPQLDRRSSQSTDTTRSRRSQRRF